MVQANYHVLAREINPKPLRGSYSRCSLPLHVHAPPVSLDLKKSASCSHFHSEIVNKDAAELILLYFKLGIICNGVLWSLAVESFSRRIKIQLLKIAWLKGKDYAGSHRFHEQLQEGNHRQHFAEGANCFWPVNSYDWLKPFGICIVAPWKARSTSCDPHLKVACFTQSGSADLTLAKTIMAKLLLNTIEGYN